MIKVVQTLPGVKRVLEGGSGYSVRGGGVDQNLVMLDGVPIYSYNHLFGLFSMFNTDAVKDIEFIKNGIPAQYGGRSSSVLNVRLKDGNSNRLEADGSVGLLSSKICLNGPIYKDKTTVMFTARRSYLDLISRPLMPKESKQFYVIADAGFKISHVLNTKSKLFAGYYHSLDRYSQESSKIFSPTSKLEFPFQFGWVNSLGFLKYVHIGERSFTNLQIYSSRYHFNYNERKVLTEENVVTKLSSLDYNSFLYDTGLNAENVFYVSGASSLKFGLGVLQRKFLPRSVNQRRNREGQLVSQNATILPSINYESAFYAELKQKVKENTTMILGLRNVFFSASSQNTVPYFEPRVTVSHNLGNNLLVKIGYHRINQFVHLLTNSGGALPTDLWVTATDKLKPQQSQQLSLGLNKVLKFNQTSISFESDLYLKKMKNLVNYKLGTNLLNITEGIDNQNNGTLTDWENTLINGQGYSRGFELLVRKNTGKFQGSLSYTWSITKNRFDDINNGDWFFSKFDRRHDLTLIGSYALKKNILLSSSFVVATGNPVTLPDYLYQPDLIVNNYTMKIAPYEVPFYSGINNYRTGMYHRLDIGIEFKKEKKRIDRSWDISIFNTYANRNPFYFKVNRLNLPEKDVLTFNPKAVPFLTIVPSISYVAHLK